MILIVIPIIAIITCYVCFVFNDSSKVQDCSSSCQSVQVSVGSTDGENAPIQELQYFCIKDKGYHVTVWPKDYDQFDVVEFSVAGLQYRTDIDNYLGEFEGTLEPEPDNDFDPNAIKILAADGHHVGYVPKDMTEEVRKFSQLPCKCYCYIGINNGTYYTDCYITTND